MLTATSGHERKSRPHLAVPMLHRIVQLAARVLSAPLGFLCVKIQDQLHLIATYGWDLPHSPQNCQELLPHLNQIMQGTRSSFPLLDRWQHLIGVDLQFIAVVPVLGTKQQPLGYLGILDQQPRQLSTDQLSHLIDLAALASEGIDTPEQHLQQKQTARQGNQSKPVATSLPENEALFEKIFDQAPNGIAISDLAGRLMRVNPAFCQTLGYSAEELLHMNLHTILQADNHDPVMTPDLSFQPGMRTHGETEQRYHHRDGHVVDVIWKMNLVRDAQGQPLYYLSQIVDISARKQAEQALLVSEARLKSLLNTLPFGIWARDSKGRIVLENPAQIKIHGQQLGLQIDNLGASETLKQSWREVNQRALAGEDVRLEVIETVAGEERIFLKIVVAVPEGSGGLGLIGVNIDITDRKQAELRIQAALQEKEALLKEIHHRVKNNLQIISSLLRLQTEAIRSKKYLKVFKDALSRIQAMSLIHEELYRSKDLTKINLVDYIQSLITNLFHSYGTHPSVIQPVISADQVSLSIDASVLCGLIVNELVTNSLKYAFPKGQHGQIQVKFQQDACTTVLTVADDGIGLPQTIEINQTESLGLQLVTALTEQLEGTLEMDRTKGTKFTISFPR